MGKFTTNTSVAYRLRVYNGLIGLAQDFLFAARYSSFLFFACFNVIGDGKGDFLHFLTKNDSVFVCESFSSPDNKHLQNTT